jgi:3-oxoacyl-[acyl-carrier-protein] synthase II
MTAIEARRMGRCSKMALAAARMAVEQSKLTDTLIGTERTAVIIGTTMGEANVLDELEQAWIHDGDGALTTAKLPRYGSTLLPIHLARAFGTRGIVQTLPAACAAGNYAIGLASDLIRAGRADVAIAGASEVMAKLEYLGFARLGAMAPERCQPFDMDRRGLMLGEGAGMLILESEEHLVRRGGHALAEVGGYGLACDAHHITRPHPEGEGSKSAMYQALKSSGIQARDVDFINAHGTGTSANDSVESRVIQDVFERPIPVSSIKSMIGHCMGAASAIEAVSCVLSLQHSILPPTTNYENPDPDCAVALVANQPQEAHVDIVLNNALAFGGYDGVVCFARPGVLPASVGMP